jgi:hypothetical protein
MTKLLYSTLISAAVSFGSAARANGSCEALLKAQRALPELINTLAIKAGTQTSGSVRFLLKAGAIKRSTVSALAQQAGKSQVRVAYDQFGTGGNQVVGIFRAAGTPAGLMAFFLSLPPDAGEFGWLDVRFDDEAKLWNKTSEQMEVELAASGQTRAEFTERSGQKREASIVRLGPEKGVGARVALFLTRERFRTVNLGRFVSVTQAVRDWRRGELGFFKIGGTPYAIMLPAMLERIQSISELELMSAGLISEAESVRQAAAPAVQPQVPVLKAPVTYASTDWSMKTKYKTVFEGPAKLDENRPFALITWMRAPAFGVVNFEFLLKYGPEKTVAALGAFTDIRDVPALAERLRGLTREDLGAALKPTRLSGQAGTKRLTDLVDNGSTLLVGPKEDNSAAILVFPLGNMRPKDPPDHLPRMPSPETAAAVEQDPVRRLHEFSGGEWKSLRYAVAEKSTKLIDDKAEFEANLADVWTDALVVEGHYEAVVPQVHGGRFEALRVKFSERSGQGDVEISDIDVFSHRELASYLRQYVEVNRLAAGRYLPAEGVSLQLGGRAMQSVFVPAVVRARNWLFCGIDEATEKEILSAVTSAAKVANQPLYRASVRIGDEEFDVTFFRNSEVAVVKNIKIPR